MAYRFGGKQKTLALGVYPAASLASARKQRDRAKQQLAEGTDPGPAKKEARTAERRAAGQSFKMVGDAWLEATKGDRKPITQSRVESWFKRDLYPLLGDMPIASIKPLDVLEALQIIEQRGAYDSAHRVLGYASGVFRYAKVLEMVPIDVTEGILEALKTPEKKNYAAIIEPTAFGGMLRAINGYEGHPYCAAALKLAPLVFVRPGELRTAEWGEMDFAAAERRIPGRKMKMKRDHIVPLSTQSMAILRDIQRVSGHGPYVFPNIKTGQKPMSDNTVNAALRTLGYGHDVHTGHGFRASARTMLDQELHERVDLIEHQLAHAVNDVNGRAYNRTTLLPERKAMMQRWADYLDRLKRGAAVVPLRA